MILEFIEAPEPQLAFYCQYHGLHNVPLADDLSPQQLEKVGSYIYCCIPTLIVDGYIH